MLYLSVHIALISGKLTSGDSMGHINEVNLCLSLVSIEMGDLS